MRHNHALYCHSKVIIDASFDITLVFIAFSFFFAKKDLIIAFLNLKIKDEFSNNL